MGKDSTTSSKFKFLDDSPVTKDEFGGHARVANSIAEQIESGVPGMTIGLEGTWGSGKSSVIRMLEERWKDRDDIAVFTFDAWAHEGDPLHRSFLEELISFLGDTERKWISREEHSDRIASFAKRVQETDTVSSPEVTGWAIAFAISWMLVPLGFAALGLANRDMGVLPWLIVGGLLVSAPLVVFVVGAWKKEKIRQLGRILTGKHTTHIHSVVSQGIDATSVEFQKAYDAILSEVFRIEGRTFVVVVDNLDRIGTKDALKLWATMKPFVESAGSIAAKGLWVIVPYDPDAIDELWADGQDDHDGLARAFKEKTFQVRYRVALPLVSRWEEYFKDCVKEAFPEEEEDVRHAAYHIFRIQGLPAYKRGTPTPREMKLFINRMVALAQQHSGDVPLPEIAMYVATELSEPELLKNLAEADFRYERHFADFFGEQWRDGLAAIHFGVKRSDAAEVLYAPMIRKYVTEGDSKSLKKLLDSPGAEQCCERHVRSAAPEMGLAEILTASAAFAKYTAETAPFYVSQSVKCLAKRIGDSDEKDQEIGRVLSPESARDVIRLMEFDHSIRDAVHQRLLVLSTDEVDERPEDVTETIETWRKTVTVIVDYLGSQDGFDPTLRLHWPSSEQYLALLDGLAADSQGKDVLRYFCPIDNAKHEYLQAYLTNIESGTIRDVDLIIIDGLLQMTCWEGEDVVGQIAAAVETGMNGTGSDYMVNGFRILHEQRNQGSHVAFDHVLKEMVDSARVLDILHENDEHPATVAFCIGTMLLYHPGIDFAEGQPVSDGQRLYREFLTDPDPQIAEDVAEYCIHFDWFCGIATSVQETIAADSVGLSAILASVVDHDDVCTCLTTERFLQHHSLIRERLDDDTEADDDNHYTILVKRLLHVRDDNLLENLQGRPIEAELAHAYDIAFDEDGIDESVLAEKLCLELKVNLSEEDWLQELRDEGFMLHVLIALLKRARCPDLNHKYVNALISHAQQVREGATKVDHLDSDWPTLLEALSEDERKQFRHELVSQIIADGQKPLSRLLPIYREELATAMTCPDVHRDEGQLRQAFINLAKPGDAETRAWLVSVFAAHPMLIREAGKTTQTNLRDRLDAFLRQEYVSPGSEDQGNGASQEQGDTGNAWRDAVQKVAKQLGIKFDKKAEKTEDSDDPENAEE